MKTISLKIITILLMGIISTNLYAQEIKWGVKGGINIANFKGDVEGNSVLTGVVLGVTGESALDDTKSLSAELLISSQGAKEDNSDVKFRLLYLNIPMLFNYHVAEKLVIKAGIQPGICLSAKLKDDDVSVNVEDEIRTFDFSIPFGLSYNLTENILLDARYNIGISNIGDFDYDEKVSNSVFAISVGYKF